MQRTYAISLLLTVALAQPAHSQAIETAVLIGYGALSAGAISSLLSRRHPPSVDAGTTVRVRLRGSTDWSQTMRVAHITPDSMVIASDSSARAFARSEIDSLQVKTSTGRWAEGWIIGAVAGGVTGAILAHESVTPGEADDWFTPNEAAVIGGVALGATASVVGAGIGLLAPSRWVTIGNPKNARVSIVPTLARPGFAARIQF